MTDLIELALLHLQQHGMTFTEATAMMTNFTKGQGKDIAWTERATSLRPAVAERIDRAAVGWMMAHRGCQTEGGAA